MRGSSLFLLCCWIEWTDSLCFYGVWYVVLYGDLSEMAWGNVMDCLLMACARLQNVPRVGI